MKTNPTQCSQHDLWSDSFLLDFEMWQLVGGMRSGEPVGAAVWR